MKRAVPLEGNKSVAALPPVTSDPVDTDIADIPKLLSTIRSNWDNMATPLNTVTAWTFARFASTPTPLPSATTPLPSAPTP
eukprot:7897951-Pyramimonas_sp.AAC.2